MGILSRAISPAEQFAIKAKIFRLAKILFKNTKAGRMETSAWKLDETYIEGWLSQFAEALDNPEILAKYKRLVKKIQQLI